MSASFSVTDPFRHRPETLARLPRVMRLYVFNCMIGFGLAGIFTGVVLWFDVAGIGRLVAAVSGGWLAALVFLVLNGIVFAGVQTGIAVMCMDYEDETPHGPARFARVAAPIAVPAQVSAGRTRR